ncbi:MAG: beta-ketoacyl synthase N-terminal-like domain-containing protein [Vicinamibacterales bacterium]
MAGWPDVQLLRAAARAGATAILNLEGLKAPEAHAALAALTRDHGERIGIRIGSSAILDGLAHLIDGVRVAIVVPGELADTIDLMRRLRCPEREVLLECTTSEEGRFGAEVGVDGLIAKGHETGGRIGDETTFVLVQRLLTEHALPIVAHGGVGRHTVGACAVAGCAGVVLDAQMALAQESTLPVPAKRVLSRMGGDETICLGAELDNRYRVYRRPGLRAVDDLQTLETELARGRTAHGDPSATWRDAIHDRVNWTGVGDALWPLGQDAVLAAPLAEAFRSVPGILAGLTAAVVEHVTVARALRPLAPGAPLAQSHRTEYPILQGPMTRVSDTAQFADAVATAGALPFLALALLRAPQVRSLLAETKARLGDRSWGVGILGFVPTELREEQLRVIEEFSPPFALIAGGRPDQAAALERHGIPTYLHVPAPSLLRMFVGDGARRFIFEGRECGGHVGPRTSFVLWESMVDVLLDVVAGGVPASDLHVVFAGGIHDARSAAMAATVGASLARLGVRIGVLMGTAYLFTTEAVASGAIVESFQEEAVKCTRTVLLESGPGHATRCADTPFFDVFRDTRRRLIEERRSLDEVRLELEELNLGRLRVAAKGVMRSADAGDRERPAYVPIGRDVQRSEGMYMIGQVAALRDATCRIADLHRAISIDSTACLEATVITVADRAAEPTATALACEVAIVGVGCLLPNASDARTLWGRILDKADGIGEIPRDRFDSDRYYDPDRHARDKVYSKWGGFLGEVPFDPLKYGIPPASLPSVDPFQLLTLEVVSQAMADAGYAERTFDRERTSVILGASGGVGDLGFRYGIRAGLPMYLDPVPEEALAQLPEWTEDSFAGVLLNVAAGRVANRLNLGGLNFTVDAACASSLAAIYVAARELQSGSSRMVIAGGIDTVNSPFGYLCFSSAQALSPTGRCRTFDESADGIAISEGLVAVVLKRVEDAERDGDRIYAVIRSVAGSSDGRGKGLTAPRPEGQVRVLERAYAAAKFSPATVSLVEAHGTGTVAGDSAEVTALTRVFGAAGAAPGSVALGSIKSMIGHTKSAAGVSGLVKVALSLYHKVLPPTLHVTRPNAKLREDGTPFFVNTEASPWLADPGARHPRRGAVSAFGFGGTNFHVVVEEYDRNSAGATPQDALRDSWPAELACWTSQSPQHLLAALRQLEERLARAPQTPLSAVAAALSRAAIGAPGAAMRLAIVATSVADLQAKIAEARDTLSAGRAHLSDPRGLYLGVSSETAPRVAFLFPGQGSQYPGMLRDLALHFSDVRHAVEEADRATEGCYPRRLSSYIFPPPSFSAAQSEQQQRELTDTEVAQPALGAVETGLADLLRRLGVRPDMTGGHSYGEYVALSVAGAFPADVLFGLSAARGRAIKSAAGDRSGTMAAVAAPLDDIQRIVDSIAGIWIANMNSPRQTVLAGHVEAIDQAIAALSAAGLSCRRIPVACAFHSPLLQQAGEVMAGVLEGTEIRPTRVPVFSNTLAAPYPPEPAAVRTILSEHITAPVRFAEQLESMSRGGAPIFVEVGPRAVLSNLTRETLGSQAPLVLSTDAPDKPGVTQLLHVLAQLSVAGVAIDIDELLRGRAIEAIQLAKLAPAAPLPAHIWLVTGGRARRQQDSVTQPRPVAVRSSPVLPASPTMPPTAPASVTTVDRASIPQGGPMQPEPAVPMIQYAVDPADDVMRQFQQIMSQFLQTQTLVMTAYLQGAPAVLPALPVMAQAAPRSLTPRPAPVVPPVMPAAAVPPRPVPAPAVAIAPAAPVVAAPAAPVAVAVIPVAIVPAEVLAQLLSIVSDRTGYPQEMLDADANIEADLGIDSIKRMEVLTAFQQAHAGTQRGAFQGAMEKLTAIKTLRETSAVLAELLAQPEVVGA